MKLEMRGQMRLEQKMKLAPHMIQSMEILQLPILALQERIEQELNSNPVLERDESVQSDEIIEPTTEERGDADVDYSRDTTVAEDFSHVGSLDDHYRDYMDYGDSFARPKSDGEVDKKLEALKNTVAPPQSLHDYLVEQWRLIDCDEAVTKAGESIIDYIDERGYLSVRLEQLYNKDNQDFGYDDLKDALELVQTLEPLGIGARDLAECLVIQMRNSKEDMSFEIRLASDHLQQLLDNKLPEIARKMNCSIDDVNAAIRKMSRFDTSPGLRIGRQRNHPVTADVIVEWDEENEEYIVKLADWDIPPLRVNRYYDKMAKSTETNKTTRDFLQGNIRSAMWIIDAIRQRKETLLKVARSVVSHQREFFDKGQLYLKPLPMSTIADEVGVHIATVSRAVAGKYIQCAWGVLPLRKFFSGGMTDEDGKGHSWEAIRGKLQQIIDAEDKAKPLSDERIRQQLAEAGISGLARRTVAKYRKLLNIPPARLRKKF